MTASRPPGGRHSPSTDPASFETSCDRLAGRPMCPPPSGQKEKAPRSPERLSCNRSRRSGEEVVARRDVGPVKLKIASVTSLKIPSRSVSIRRMSVVLFHWDIGRGDPNSLRRGCRRRLEVGDRVDRCIDHLAGARSQREGAAMTRQHERTAQTVTVKMLFA